MKRLWKQLDLKKRLKMDLKDKIFNYIINSNRINESIDNIVEDKKYIEDFKQHFYIQMLEMDEEKLKRAYLDGWIDWLCIRVMLNQWRSKNSSFYTTYKNTNFKYLEEGQDFEDKKEVEIEFNYTMAEVILNNRKEKWIHKQYHMTLFKLYFKDGHNYKKINELTGVSIGSIAHSVNKSLDYIRKKVK